MVRRPHIRVSIPAGLGRFLGRAFGGISAVGVKELRGRMRGRRAFVILTIYLAILAAFGWMVEQIVERNYVGQFGGFNYASAQIGQQVFVWLLMLETLLVPFLAPALTAGAISQEREKQTLDMLAATPISSLSIVVGKLLSALTYIFLLIFASIPLTALVFVYGGVAPEDLIRGYVVLVATAIGFGSIGVFFSALVQRTQPATTLSYFAVLGVTLGALFVWIFWLATGFGGMAPTADSSSAPRRPPEALLYLNPFAAQADVVCGTETGFGTFCGIVSGITDQPVFGGTEVVPPVPQPAPKVILNDTSSAPGVVQAGPLPQPFGVRRDTFWPKSVAAWAILSAILIALSVQLVSPTRRWRPRRPAFLRRAPRGAG